MSSSESSTLRVRSNCRKFTQYFYKTKEINDKFQKYILVATKIVRSIKNFSDAVAMISTSQEWQNLPHRMCNYQFNFYKNFSPQATLPAPNAIVHFALCILDYKSSPHSLVIVIL